MPVETLLRKSPSIAHRAFARWRLDLAALTLGVIAGSVVMLLWRGGGETTIDSTQGETTAIAKNDAPAPEEPQFDSEVLRRQAWDRIARRLPAADQASAGEIEQALRPIGEFFDERQPGVRGFAKATLSLRGKWAFIKSKLPTREAAEHLDYLDRKFSEHVFEPGELKKVIEQAVKDYFKSLDAIENKLLVESRAEIAELDTRAGEWLPFSAGDKLFAAEYRQMIDEIVTDVSRETKLTAGRETVSLIGGEVAAVIAMRVGVAVATKLGIDAGILGTGAASSWATLGLGLAAAIVVDLTVEWAMKVAGHDPVTAVASKVESTLDQVRTLIIDGDPEAFDDYHQLRRLAEIDSDERVRARCAEAVRVIEQSGRLGLRHELWRVHHERARLREAALRRMVLDAEANQ
jgi:hypothetical protein